MNWRVEVVGSGKAGCVGYYEEPNAVSFDFELGGGDPVLIIYIGRASEWSRRCPWAAERRAEILGRLADELIRENGPGYKAEIDEAGGFMYLREGKAVA